MDAILAGAALFLGLMSKESAVVFCILIPLSAWVFLTPDRRRIIVVSASLLAGTALYLIIRQLVLGTIHAHTTDLINDPFLEASFAQKYATIFYTLLLYLKLLVFPHPLTFDYYPYHIPLVSWADWRPLAGFLANGALLIAALAGIRRKRPWALGLWAYLLPLSIVSNLLVPIGVFMAERFMYIPSIAFCLFAAYALVQWIPAGMKRNPRAGTTAAVAVFGIVFLAFSAKSFDRTQAWKDDFTLATTDVKVSPESVKSNAMAGDEERRRADTMSNPITKREYLASAEKHLRVALSVFPRYETGCILLGRVLQSEGIYGNSPRSRDSMYRASADAFRTIFAFSPRSSQAQANLGALFAQQLWNPDSAIAHLRIALQEDERIADAHYNIGTVFLMNGTGPDSAIAHLRAPCSLIRAMVMRSTISARHTSSRKRSARLWTCTSMPTGCGRNSRISPRTSRSCMRRWPIRARRRREKTWAADRMTSDFESLIDDFTASPHYLFLDGKAKEHGAGLLSAFASACGRRGVRSPEQLTGAVFEQVMLSDFPCLDAPLEARRAVPGLLREFFRYLAESGRFPAASSWTGWVAPLEKKYQALFREDGSVKGETFRKKYTDVNRNDPCPCGSGRKFKKCCMDLIS